MLHLNRQPQLTTMLRNAFGQRSTVESNYPIKRAMNAVLHSEVNEIFDLGDPVMKYAVSWVMLYVSHDAIQHLLMSLNYYRFPAPQGCIPIENMIQTSRTVKAWNT